MSIRVTRSYDSASAKLGYVREADLSQTFKRAGADVLSLSTEEDLVQAVLRFATLRKQTRRKQR